MPEKRSASCAQHYRNSISLGWSWKFRTTHENARPARLSRNHLAPQVSILHSHHHSRLTARQSGKPDVGVPQPFSQIEQRIGLLLSASGLSIRVMHGIFRIVVTAVVLAAFSLSATDSLLLSSGWKATAEDASCPLHRVKCCCPKVCKTPPKAEPSCHKSAKPTEQLSTAETTSGAACVVKAGCGKQETSVGFLPLLKDFVPESLEQIGFDRSLSSLVSAKDRFLLLDSSPHFFHPPRNS